MYAGKYLRQLYHKCRRIEGCTERQGFHTIHSGKIMAVVDYDKLHTYNVIQQLLTKL